ncbi:hypothetical protein DI57_02225 [Enterobacter asburiae L1]|nr:hypothetical protein DI57_02225 [Enterobacter asburiae L1]
MDNEYILKTLDKRARSTRLIMITFVYIMLFSMMAVIAGIISLKANNNNSVNDIISNLFHKNTNDTDAFIDKMIKKSQNEINKTKTEINEGISDTAFNTKIILQGLFSKDPSEKIADAITSIIVSLSILFFIGYVMKIMIVFIKYYMQLSNEYDNQKMSFLMSKGDINDFPKILDSLRTHNISFDKTPVMAQEKIILGLIDALGFTKSKNKDG